MKTNEQLIQEAIENLKSWRASQIHFLAFCFCIAVVFIAIAILLSL
jgi:hypothetical protein